jgi:hypothetical protein
MEVDMEKLDECLINMLDRVDLKYRKSVLVGVMILTYTNRLEIKEDDKEMLKKVMNKVILTISELLDENPDTFIGDLEKVLVNSDYIMNKTIIRK